MTAGVRFVHTPPAPLDKPGPSLFQRIELRDGRQLIGQVLWHLIDVDEGVAQIVDLAVDPKHRRKGHGGALLTEAVAQARSACKSKRVPLRRVWVALEQKTQVVARAFLTKHGFHHTSSVPDLLRDQDLLVYVKSYD